MRRLLLSSALSISAGLFAATHALANDDGFYTVDYNQIGFDLTQVGGYGELVVRAQGYKGMDYGSCTLNFTRDAEGNIQKKTPVVQSNAATCPDNLDFSVEGGRDGMYELTFSNAGPLSGETFQLFPVLVPMYDHLRPVTPKGFDILGMTIGQTRAEIEATLGQKGYSRLDLYEETIEFDGDFSKSTSLWGKGQYSHNPQEPADMIAVTYSPVETGTDEVEKVEYLARNWRISAEENVSLAALKKSLTDKHGTPFSAFEDRYYDWEGVQNPKAFQEVCAPHMHLQKITTHYVFVGEAGEVALAPSCGAAVKVMTLENFDAPGRAGQLRIALSKGDVAYEGFYRTWTATEEGKLKERYDLQSGVNTSAPEL